MLIDGLSTKFKNTETICQEILSPVLVLANPLSFLKDSSKSAANEAELAMLKEENEVLRVQLENLSKVNREKEALLASTNEKLENSTLMIHNLTRDNAILDSDFKNAQEL